MPSKGSGHLYYSKLDIGYFKCLVAANFAGNFDDLKKEATETGFRLDIDSQVLHDTTAASILLSDDKFSFRQDVVNMSRLIQWTSFSRNDVIPFMVGLLKTPSLTRDDRFQNKLRQSRLDESLIALNRVLESSQFLIGKNLSLADVNVALDMAFGFVSQPPIIPASKYSNLHRWFNEVSSHPHFRKICDVSQMSCENKSAAKNAPKNIPAQMTSRPLKILCLHGYRQNEVLFRDKLGAFRKIVGKSAEFTFVTAPHKVPPLDDQPTNEDQRGWWFSREDNFFKASFVSDLDKGFNESLNIVFDVCKKFGPFDGVLGFSQGAALSSVLCSMQCKKVDVPFSFRFAILFAGFKSQCSKHEQWYDKSNKIAVPSLHVYGTDDKVIGNMSVELVDFFQSPSIVEHPGGHFIPATSKQKEAYLGFLSNFKTS